MRNSGCAAGQPFFHNHVQDSLPRRRTHSTFVSSRVGTGDGTPPTLVPHSSQRRALAEATQHEAVLFEEFRMPSSVEQRHFTRSDRTGECRMKFTSLHQSASRLAALSHGTVPGIPCLALAGTLHVRVMAYSLARLGERKKRSLSTLVHSEGHQK